MNALRLMLEEVKARVADDLDICDLTPEERENREWRRSMYEVLKREVGKPLSPCPRASRLIEIRAFGMAFEDGHGGIVSDIAHDAKTLQMLYEPSLKMINQRELAGNAHAQLLLHRLKCPLCSIFPPKRDFRLRTAGSRYQLHTDRALDPELGTGKRL